MIGWLTRLLICHSCVHFLCLRWQHFTWHTFHRFSIPCFSPEFLRYLNIVQYPSGFSVSALLLGTSNTKQKYADRTLLLWLQEEGSLDMWLIVFIHEFSTLHVGASFNRKRLQFKWEFGGELCELGILLYKVWQMVHIFGLGKSLYRHLLGEYKKRSWFQIDREKFLEAIIPQPTSFFFCHDWVSLKFWCSKFETLTVWRLGINTSDWTYRFYLT